MLIESATEPPLTVPAKTQMEMDEADEMEALRERIADELRKLEDMIETPQKNGHLRSVREHAVEVV
jgi:hypothetical protein